MGKANNQASEVGAFSMASLRWRSSFAEAAPLGSPRAMSPRNPRPPESLTSREYCDATRAKSPLVTPGANGSRMIPRERLGSPDAQDVFRYRFGKSSPDRQALPSVFRSNNPQGLEVLTGNSAETDQV